MAKYKVKVVRQAKSHLTAIKEYIAFELLAPDTAKTMLKVLRQSIRSLSDEPYRIKTIDEQPWGSQGIRKTRVKNYYIYFWIDEGSKCVYVIAVIYVARNQEEQLAKLSFDTE